MVRHSFRASAHSIVIIFCLTGCIYRTFPYGYEHYFLIDRSYRETAPLPYVTEFPQRRDYFSSNQSKKILVWTPAVSIRDDSSDTKFLEWIKGLGQRCTYECEIDSREKINEDEASAIIFHSRTMRIDDLPERRRSDQIYIWACHEEPHRCGDIDKQLAPAYFNTSLTNLRDGVAYNYGYGEIVRTNDERMLKKISDKEWSQMYAKKTNLGIAIISNCFTSSKREYYLRELSSYIQISLHGSCYSRNKICTEQNDSNGCLKELLDAHFFYFSFENAICTDYVTEKVFDRLINGLVPVVLRRRILEGVIPSDAFIAADDFDAPKDLAIYLVKVSKDERLYKSYFAWRESHAFSEYLTMGSNGICALCADLWKKTPRSSANYVVRDHYSDSICEADVGCKLVGRHCKSKRNNWFQDPR